ncbi:class I SAM-dependent methyltransferase, partial [Salmonella enterica subsp. enterica serovar Senftenberg]|nr:class I SAM-dependent methyltransferase [Salmonella enterica subsp. enterica serovar Senftenberg]
MGQLRPLGGAQGRPRHRPTVLGRGRRLQPRPQLRGQQDPQPLHEREGVTRDRTAENVEQFYSSLSATGYDALKAGDDRQVWAAQLRPLLHRHAPGAATALDLGCGTGDSAAMLADFGLRVVGCDIATDMLESARRKYPHIHFRQADIRTVPPDLRGFDVVTMCGDIPNHLLSQADLVATLRGAVAALRVGGVL